MFAKEGHAVVAHCWKLHWYVLIETQPFCLLMIYSVPYIRKPINADGQISSYTVKLEEQ